MLIAASWLHIACVTALALLGLATWIAVGFAIDDEKTRHLFHVGGGRTDCGRCRQRHLDRWREMAARQRGRGQ